MTRDDEEKSLKIQGSWVKSARLTGGENGLVHWVLAYAELLEGNSHSTFKVGRAYQGVGVVF